MERDKRIKRKNGQKSDIVTGINIFKSCSNKNTEVELKEEKYIVKRGFSTGSLSVSIEVDILPEKFDFELLENAMDSLNEAILKYNEGEAGDHKAYKFCILHFSHFLELLFKYYVYKSHPLLIYKNPFAKKIDKDSFTIGLLDAIQFLKNEGKGISKSFSNDLDWIKSLRNRIEHHKFSMNVAEVKGAIGRLMKTVYEFNEKHSNIQIDKFLDNIDVYDAFHELANTYQHRISEAEKLIFEAEEEAYKSIKPSDRPFVNFEVMSCPKCHEYTFITSSESNTGFICTFCGNKSPDN